jgi:hypothetical protein
VLEMNVKESILKLLEMPMDAPLVDIEGNIVVNIQYEPQASPWPSHADYVIIHTNPRQTK